MLLTPATRIEVLVLVDNVTDVLSSTPLFVMRETVRMVRRGIRPTTGAAFCCAAHGLSLVITAYGPAGPKTMMFDGGPSDFMMEMNGKRLGVDFGATGAVTLSHGHWDHAGGIPRALGMIRAANGGRPVPLFLHPAMFQQRGLRMPDGGVLPGDPFPTPEAWTQFGAQPTITTEPVTCLEDMFFISGEIPRVTAYEKGLEPQVRRVTPDGPWEPEPGVIDEQFLAVNVRDKGLVVFSGCSHAGVVNVLRHAQVSVPGVKLYAVIGGFHLAGGTEAIIPETVRDIRGVGLEHIIAGHCTGWRAMNALQQTLGEQIVEPLAVGKTFNL